MTCVSQSSCSKGFGGALGWSGASVLAAAGCQAFFYMKGSGADLLPGRRWCWCLKMTAPALCLFFALHAVVYMNFLHIWEKVTPAQTARVCVWWAMWSLLAMQATVCRGLSYKKDRGKKTKTSFCHAETQDTPDFLLDDSPPQRSDFFRF